MRKRQVETPGGTFLSPGDPLATTYEEWAGFLEPGDVVFDAGWALIDGGAEPEVFVEYARAVCTTLGLSLPPMLSSPPSQGARGPQGPLGAGEFVNRVTKIAEGSLAAARIRAALDDLVKPLLHERSIRKASL